MAFVSPFLNPSDAISNDYGEVVEGLRSEVVAEGDLPELDVEQYERQGFEAGSEVGEAYGTSRFDVLSESLTKEKEYTFSRIRKAFKQRKKTIFLLIKDWQSKIDNAKNALEAGQERHDSLSDRAERWRVKFNKLNQKARKMTRKFEDKKHEILEAKIKNASTSLKEIIANYKNILIDRSGALKSIYDLEKPSHDEYEKNFQELLKQLRSSDLRAQRSNEGQMTLFTDSFSGQFLITLGYATAAISGWLLSNFSKAISLEEENVFSLGVKSLVELLGNYTSGSSTSALLYLTGFYVLFLLFSTGCFWIVSKRIGRASFWRKPVLDGTNISDRNIELSVDASGRSLFSAWLIALPFLLLTGLIVIPAVVGLPVLADIDALAKPAEDRLGGLIDSLAAQIAGTALALGMGGVTYVFLSRKRFYRNMQSDSFANSFSNRLPRTIGSVAFVVLAGVFAIVFLGGSGWVVFNTNLNAEMGSVVLFSAAVALTSMLIGYGYTYLDTNREYKVRQNVMTQVTNALNNLRAPILNGLPLAEREKFNKQYLAVTDELLACIRERDDVHSDSTQAENEQNTGKKATFISWIHRLKSGQPILIRKNINEDENASSAPIAKLAISFHDRKCFPSLCTKFDDHYKKLEFAWQQFNRARDEFEATTVTGTDKHLELRKSITIWTDRIANLRLIAESLVVQEGRINAALRQLYIECEMSLSRGFELGKWWKKSAKSN